MKDEDKTKRQLINELVDLRQRITDLQTCLDPRRRMEEALQSEREKLKSLMDGLTRTEIGIDIIGVEYEVLFQNQTLKERFGDLTGKLCYEKYMGLKTPCDFCPMIKAIKSNKVESVELTGIDGRNYELFSAPLPNPDGTVDKAIEVVIDITERKQAERQIKAALREKEILLREIRHRIKNNLQVISSMLYLQSEYIKDKEALEMFRESQHRIESMALIHEKLYQSKDLGKFDLAEYIRELATDLFSSYGVKPDGIKLKINVHNVLLGVNTAIPCGLIINELVSNSLKHAFPDGKEGEIRIDLSSDNDNTFTLIVSDNSVGLPKDLDFRNTETMGLQLVITLVEQLKGTIELDRSAGTAFKISFAELNYKERGP